MTGPTDPRLYQIGVLTSLLAYGSLALDFEVAAHQAALTLPVALATQALCGRLFGLRRFDPKSALISGLSLALLLRTSDPQLAVAGAVIAIASKFALRWRGKHLWNPTCFALVVLLLASDRVWVSAGQWGSAAFFALAVAGLGQLVVRRAERSDVTFGFLASYTSVLLGRALWLGDPLAIPLHGLQSGAFLIFAFFMISDPRSLPDARAGRLLYSAGVAVAAAGVQFGLHAPNPLLFALAACAPAVPLLDRLLPGERHAWTSRAPVPPQGLSHRRGRPETPAMTDPVNHATTPAAPGRARGVRARAAIGSAALAAPLALLLPPAPAEAFCGFYVARADARLENRASQVVLVRDGDRSVVTMSNDYEGEPNDFAMVIPVPTLVRREQIHLGDRAAIEHLDAYTSPRLVEYFDPDPCAERRLFDAVMEQSALPSVGRLRKSAARARGVTIEATYQVGEYDILILSAEQSDGLARWLEENGYRIPEGAAPVLASYIRQGQRFFVARVNLQEHARLGRGYLRPLQVAFESPKFGLPIRLGTLNAAGPQELLVYTLTRRGRVETTNYRSVKVPSDLEIPSFVKGEFGDFYRALFDREVEREDMRVVFTEYAWDMGWCDPCAADPLSREELRGLGVFWLEDADAAPGPARDVFVTRLHLRYDADRFPADLVFQQTGDRTNFQGRYVLRHAFEGPARCPAAQAYQRRLRERWEREARTLASLTGWDLAEIRRRMALAGARPELSPGEPAPWWQRLWN